MLIDLTIVDSSKSIKISVILTNFTTSFWLWFLRRPNLPAILSVYIITCPESTRLLSDINIWQKLSLCCNIYTQWLLLMLQDYLLQEFFFLSYWWSIKLLSGYWPIRVTSAPWRCNFQPPGLAISAVQQVSSSPGSHSAENTGIQNWRRLNVNNGSMQNHGSALNMPQRKPGDKAMLKPFSASSHPKSIAGTFWETGACVASAWMVDLARVGRVELAPDSKYTHWLGGNKAAPPVSAAPSGGEECHTSPMYSMCCSFSGVKGDKDTTHYIHWKPSSSITYGDMDQAVRDENL